MAAIEKFIAGRKREEWMRALSSHEFRLLIDPDYGVSVAKIAFPTAALYLFSDPLENLRLDPWAIEFGGMLRKVALEDGADTVVRALDRLEWWVP